MPAPLAPTPAQLASWEKGLPATKSPKKKSNPLMVLAVAVMVILGASGLWRAVHAPAKGKFVKVVAINKDTAPGIRLGFFSVHYFDVPQELVTPDMVRDLNDISGMVAKTYLQAGEPIKSWMLFPKRDVSLTLENNERAITLELSDDALVDHSILPEDVVDIIAVSTKDGKKYTKTICQSARVMMASPKEQALARGGVSNGLNRITLAVDSRLTELLSEAAETGKLRLVLRNRLSRVNEHLIGAGPDDLLPASAFEKAKIVQSTLSHALPPPPAMSTAPIQAVAEPPESTSPIQWVVEMFSGSKKENCEVPQK